MEKTIKIVVPVDFSECSDNALVFAMALGNKVKAHLTLLHIPSIGAGRNLENPMYASALIEEKNAEAKRRIKKSIDKAIQIIGTPNEEIPPVEVLVEMGMIDATICEVADRLHADYILMGTQGENSTLDKYLGSVASNVLKNATCSVMVIPEDSVLEQNLMIGYTTNFLDADPFEIWRTTTLFKGFNPQVKCVHFSKNAEDNDEQTRELVAYFADTAPDLSIDFYNLESTDKVKDLKTFIDREQINLLVMYKAKRAFFESIFHSSFTEKMARHTKIPLLVHKEKE